MAYLVDDFISHKIRRSDPNRLLRDSLYQAVDLLLLCSSVMLLKLRAKFPFLMNEQSQTALKWIEPQSSFPASCCEGGRCQTAEAVYRWSSPATSFSFMSSCWERESEASCCLTNLPEMTQVLLLRCFLECWWRACQCPAACCLSLHDRLIHISMEEHLLQKIHPWCWTSQVFIDTPWWDGDSVISVSVCGFFGLSSAPLLFLPFVLLVFSLSSHSSTISVDLTTSNLFLSFKKNLIKFSTSKESGLKNNMSEWLKSFS